MKPTLLVLSAGIGSRYGGIKQLDRFGPSGEKIIDYTIYDAIRSGFERIVFVIRRGIELDFHAAVTDRWQGRIPMEFVFQELDAVPAGFRVPGGREKPWGTGHAVLTAMDAIHGPFAVVNADDFYGATGLGAVFAHLTAVGMTDNAEYCLVGYRLRQTLSDHGSVARGICRADSRGYLTSLVETTGIVRKGRRIVRCDPAGECRPLDPDTLVSMNLWGFTPSYFRHLETDFRKFMEERGRDPKAEFYLTGVIDRLIRSGQEKVKVLPTEAMWFGVTYREDRSMVEHCIRELVRTGEYPTPLWFPL